MVGLDYETPGHREIQLKIAFVAEITETCGLTTVVIRDWGYDCWTQHDSVGYLGITETNIKPLTKEQVSVRRLLFTRGR